MCRYLVLIAAMCLGCFTPGDKAPRSDRPAPDGNTFQSDMNGVLRPTFVADTVLTQMDAVDVASSANEFRGVSFNMASGAMPQITVVGQPETAYRAFIYGPQTEQGLWGQSLYEASGVNTIVIADWMAEESGHYLLLALPTMRQSFEYSVSVVCDGCEVDRCELDDPCNSYCPQGRAIDASSGCTTCECAGASCVTEGCSVDNELCVFRCGEGSCAAGQMCNLGRCENRGCDMECGADEACFEGRCELASYECAAETVICEESCPPLRAPVCAEVDGRLRTVPNRCLAECLESTSIMPGPCQPAGCEESSECADGEQCRSGMCVPGEACGCDPNVEAPVCGEKMGQRKTFRNTCEMTCEGYSLEYEGTCIDVPQCETSLDCRGSERCIPLPDSRVAGNEARCRESSDSNGCVRACIGRQRCRMNGDCSAESHCVLQGEEGLCMPTCSPNSVESSCVYGEKCVTSLVDPASDATGLCLTKCGEGTPCTGSMTCSNLENVCLKCDACEFSTEAPICLDQRLYSNGCEMLCEAVFSIGSAATVRTPVQAEMCNGLDDNCNGQIDEELEQTCETGSARCRAGRQTCSDGAWGPCELVPIDVIEQCNGLDDDCDGEIDEAPVLLQAGQTDCTAPSSDCRACSEDWTPVCTERGIAPNECFAECEGLSIKPMSDCGLRQAPITRCSSNDDCMKSRCVRGEQSVCGGSELQLLCVEYTATGACFELSGTCACNRNLGTCGFQPTAETFDCVEERPMLSQDL